MDFQRTKEELATLINGEVRLSELMSKHTTWRVGGPADLLALPQGINDVIALVKYAKEQQIPYTLIGNGSNLLVRDKGIRGLVIKIGHNMSQVEITGEKVKAEAGVLLPKLANLFLAHQLTGLEFAAGIPATLGGAVVMNAGAHGGQISDLVTGIKIVDAQGQLQELTREELGFAYRTSSLSGSGFVVLNVYMEAVQGEVESIKTQMASNLRYRQASQPQGWPNAGSVFKNSNGNTAGKLIDELGCKGLKIGGAMVSEQHANFIINTGAATAEDILNLIERVRQMVLQRHGLLLEPEVRILGEG